MAFDDYMTQIAQARQDVGQRIAGIPKFETDLRTEVYGQEQAIPSLRNQISDKIRGLYDADKRAADVYANTQSPMYIRDPYQREKYLSTQHQAELGSIQGLQNLLAGRQDVLGNAIDKGLQIYQAGLEASKWQHGALLDELGAAISASKASGGGGGGGTTGGLKYTDIFKMLGQQPPVNQNQVVTNESGIRWQYDPNTGSMQPADYPGYKYMPEWYNLLLANPEQDVAYGESYGAGLTQFPYKAPTAGSSYLGLGVEQQTSSNLQYFLQQLSATDEGVFKDLNEVSDMAASIDPNLVYDPNAWNRIVQVANSKGIY
jgi:hypothetical protein